MFFLFFSFFFCKIYHYLWRFHKKYHFRKLSMDCRQNRQRWRGSMKPETGQSSSDADFRARSGSSLYCSALLDPWWSTFCRRRRQWPVTTTQEHYQQKLLPLSGSSSLTWESQEERCYSNAMRLPHKARATAQCLEGEQLRALAHPPYSPNVIPFDVSLSLKTGLPDEERFLTK